MNKGFTLIELLVVVLIIGILAAIAMPQYRFAVEKSKLTEVMIAVKSVENRLKSAAAANTQLPADTKFINLSGGHWVGESYQTRHYSYGNYACEGETCSFVADTLPPGRYALKLSVNKQGVTRQCYNYGTSLGEKVCQFMQESGNWQSVDGQIETQPE